MSAKVGIRDILSKQRPWSLKTFGSGKRTKGITEHIAKELVEINDDPDDLMEWVDVILLALDGAWRSGYTDLQVEEAIRIKQSYNMARVWPKFEGNAAPDVAIEHVRVKQK